MPKLAITGGKPIRRKAFPPWPVYSNQEARALMRVLRSGNWGGYPFPNTHAGAFAAKFAKAHGAKYGIAVSNGTVAIGVSWRASGIKAGGEVILPDYTWHATLGPIVL